MSDNHPISSEAREAAEQIAKELIPPVPPPEGYYWSAFEAAGIVTPIIQAAINKATAELTATLETVTKGSFDGMQALAKDNAQLRAERDEAMRDKESIRIIMAELYKAVERLGGGMVLLAAIGSYGDTLPDDEVIAHLQAYNDAALKATGKEGDV